MALRRACLSLAGPRRRGHGRLCSSFRALVVDKPPEKKAPVVHSIIEDATFETLPSQAGRLDCLASADTSSFFLRCCKRDPSESSHVIRYP